MTAGRIFHDCWLIVDHVPCLWLQHKIKCGKSNTGNRKVNMIVVVTS